jgi:H+-transporting ATPase
MASSAVDLLIVSVLALNGFLMTALPIAILASLLAAAIIFAFLLNSVKVMVFRHLMIEG